MQPPNEPAEVRAAVEDLMHRVDELQQRPAVGSERGPDGAAVQVQQTELFEQAHQLLVDALGRVERA